MRFMLKTGSVLDGLSLLQLGQHVPSVPVRAYLPPASRPRHNLSCFFRSRLANGRRHARFYATNSVAEIIEPVDEWRVHETSNREKRSQGQGKHHSEKVMEKSDEDTQGEPGADWQRETETESR